MILTSNCCKFGLLKWLETTPDATWNQLIRALRSSSVQLDHFASHLEMMMTSQRMVYSNYIVVLTYVILNLCLVLRCSRYVVYY